MEIKLAGRKRYVHVPATRDKVTLKASSANPTINSVHSCP